jgi:AraC-like DNA-binding protein
VGDELSRVLRCVRWSVLDYRHEVLDAGTVRAGTGDDVRFLFVLSGAVLVDGLDGGGPRRLEGGRFLLLPRGGTHTVTVLERAELHAGELVAETGDAVLLVRVMPAAVVTCGVLVEDPFVELALRQMALESAAGRPGSVPVLAQLANVVTTAAIRWWVESGCESARVLEGFLHADDVSRALQAIHDDPGAPWTVEGLARLTFASRSVFAQRFRSVVGETPVRYLAQVRMEAAKRLLTDGSGVTDTAVRLGYSSDAAFSRAFRRHTGAAPSQWREVDAARSSAPPAMAATAPTT